MPTEPKAAHAPHQWSFAVREAKEKLEIDVYDFIGSGIFTEGVTAKSVLEKLRGSKATDVQVRISSSGGILDEAKSIYNLLRERSANGSRVTVKIDSLAASAASVIAMAGDEIVMPSNAFIMIHNATAGMRGGAQDFTKLAERMKREERQMADIYAGSSSRRGKDKTAAEFLSAMKTETYFDAKEAVEWGLADTITDDVQVAAYAVDISAFEAPPEALKSAPYVASKPSAVLGDLVGMGLIGHEKPTLEISAVPAATPTAAIAEQPKETPMPEETKTEAAKAPEPAPVAKPEGFIALLGVSNETEALAKVSENQRSILQILAATGKPSIGEAMPLVLEWRTKAAQADVLTKQVGELTEAARVAKRDGAIEKLSREGKLPPARHEWARMQFQTAEAVESFCVGMPSSFFSGITEPNDPNANLTLSDEERKICALTGVTEKAFLEQKKLERSRPQPPAGV
jgi:ATP-dependent protease ClpP protease subunit